MGRKAFFTEKEVFETADTLVAEGKEVSATALLTALGGGSYTTIYKHLERWKEDRPELAQETAPSEIPDQVQTAFLSTWRTATNEAAREVAAVKEKAAEEVRVAQKQLKEALGQIERLEIDAESDSEKIESLTTQNSELESALKKSQNEATTYKATAEQLQKQVQSLEESRKSDQEEKTKLQKERDQALTEAAKLQGKVETLLSQNDNLLSRLKEPESTKSKKRTSK